MNNGLKNVSSEDWKREKFNFYQMGFFIGKQHPIKVLLFAMRSNFHVLLDRFSNLFFNCEKSQPLSIGICCSYRRTSF